MHNLKTYLFNIAYFTSVLIVVLALASTFILNPGIAFIGIVAFGIILFAHMEVIEPVEKPESSQTKLSIVDYYERIAQKTSN